MERAFELVELDFPQIENICSDYFKEGHLQAREHLSGGAVNTTYKLIWDGVPYILRFYVRDPALLQVEEAIYHLIPEKVPVAEMLYSGVAKNDYPFAIFEFINKKHIFEITDHTLAPALSYHLGKGLAGIHSFHFPKAGLFGKGLAIHSPFEEGSSPYFSYTMEHLLESSLVWKRLGNERALNLKSFLQEHQNFFPTISQGGVLVHSDFKPVNLLWDEYKGLTILDWEFAHIGHPLIDLAILLRHFQDFPFSIESLERGYFENGGVLTGDWVRKARITDTINLVQLLNTPADRPRLFKTLLQAIDYTMSNWSSLDEKMREICRKT